MASNVTNEHSKESSPNVMLKNVGKFWIMKIKDTWKRLVFLDNAKDVFINGNILIADERLFEMLEKGKGEIIFRKLEDVTYEKYLNVGEISKELLDLKKEVAREGDRSKTHSERSQTESIYDEPDNLKANTITVNKDNVTSSCLTSVKLMNKDQVPCEMGHEEYNPLDFGSAEAYDNKHVEVEKPPSTTSEGEEFEVEIVKSDLARRCRMEGKMKMSIQDFYISFKHPKTCKEIYKFHLTWIKRYGKKQSLSLFQLEVGRKCPVGCGAVICKTEMADKIQKLVTQRCLEIKNAGIRDNQSSQ